MTVPLAEIEYVGRVLQRVCLWEFADKLEAEVLIQRNAIAKLRQLQDEIHIKEKTRETLRKASQAKIDKLNEIVQKKRRAIHYKLSAFKKKRVKNNEEWVNGYYEYIQKHKLALENIPEDKEKLQFSREFWRQDTEMSLEINRLVETRDKLQKAVDKSNSPGARLLRCLIRNKDWVFRILTEEISKDWHWFHPLFKTMMAIHTEKTVKEFRVRLIDEGIWEFYLDMGGPLTKEESVYFTTFWFNILEKEMIPYVALGDPSGPMGDFVILQLKECFRLE